VPGASPQPYLDFSEVFQKSAKPGTLRFFAERCQFRQGVGFAGPFPFLRVFSVKTFTPPSATHAVPRPPLRFVQLSSKWQENAMARTLSTRTKTSPEKKNQVINEENIN
jgi:hypothetical protein